MENTENPNFYLSEIYLENNIINFTDSGLFVFINITNENFDHNFLMNSTNITNNQFYFNSEEDYNSDLFIYYLVYSS